MNKKVSFEPGLRRNDGGSRSDMEGNAVTQSRGSNRKGAVTPELRFRWQDSKSVDLRDLEVE